jgi:putative Mg2+ transporter-C (MgtC) family protein
MVQVNYLLPLAGRHPDSFVMNDLMRFPLGILTGVGYIGAGAILRRRELIIGVTTAATLWYVTVIGLCFGGGQLFLGWVAAVIGLGVLWLLRWFEEAMLVEVRFRLAITLGGDRVDDVRARLKSGGLAIKRVNLAVDSDGRRYTFDVVTQRKKGRRITAAGDRGARQRRRYPTTGLARNHLTGPVNSGAALVFNSIVI